MLVQTERWGTPVADRLREIPGVVLAYDVPGPLATSTDDGGIHRILNAVRDVPSVLLAIAAPLISAAGSDTPIVAA